MRLKFSEFINSSSENIKFSTLQEFLQNAANFLSDSVNEQSKIKFPDNINFFNFSYFLLSAPTLVYEVSYPRTMRVRFRYVYLNSVLFFKNSYVLKEVVGFCVCLAISQILSIVYEYLF